MTEAITRQVQDLRWAELQDELAGLRAIITPQCPACESMKGQWRGYRHNKKQIIHRRWCTQCGKWFIGAQHIKRTCQEDAAEKEHFLREKLAHDACADSGETDQAIRRKRITESEGR